MLDEFDFDFVIAQTKGACAGTVTAGCSQGFTTGFKCATNGSGQTSCWQISLATTCGGTCVSGSCQPDASALDFCTSSFWGTAQTLSCTCQ